MNPRPRLFLVLLPIALAGCATPRMRPGVVPGRRALVLHDESGPHGWLGELYAVAAGNLASRFGAWAAAPVGRYRPGDLRRFDAAIYVGSTHGEAIPDAFVEDVIAEDTPVIWVHANVWEVAQREPRFAAHFGFVPWRLETGPVTEVLYKGERLTRVARNDGGIMTYAALDRGRVEILAEAVLPGGERVPWALRSRNLTYVGDNPFAYLGETDRYLAFADLLFDVLAPGAPERHRALVRLEDVSPLTPPADLRAAVDVLAAEGVPFSVGVIPAFVDPAGTSRPGGPGTTALREVPALVDALRDAVARGGTLVLHGFTHQHGTAPNPYTGATADDFEFWTARLDPGERVVLTGPVPEDSPGWAADRIERALAEFDRAGLPRPRIFEFPHYAGSGVAGRAIARRIGAAYHRGWYFAGALDGEDRDTSRQIGQIFPYEVRDVYGFAMVPENCGPFRPLPFGPEPANGLEEIVRCARANRVVRDGWASFFYHPSFGAEPLRRLVAAVRELGYRFVPPPLSPGR